MPTGRHKICVLRNLVGLKGNDILPPYVLRIGCTVTDLVTQIGGWSGRESNPWEQDRKPALPTPCPAPLVHRSRCTNTGSGPSAPARRSGEAARRAANRPLRA